MNLKINFHQVDSTPTIKEMISKKSEKLSKYFNGKFDVNWTCSMGREGHHSHVQLTCNGFTVNADSTLPDLYKTFDAVVGKLEKQLAKKKDKSREHIHHKHSQSPKAAQTSIIPPNNESEIQTDIT